MKQVNRDNEAERLVLFTEESIIRIFDKAIGESIPANRGYVLNVMFTIFFRIDEKMLQYYLDEATKYISSHLSPEEMRACFSVNREHKQAVQSRVDKSLYKRISGLNPNQLIIATLLYFELI